MAAARADADELDALPGHLTADQLLDLSPVELQPAVDIGDVAAGLADEVGVG